MKKLYFLFLCLVMSSRILHAQSWSEVGGNTNALKADNSIRSILTDKAGNVYAAGGFTDGAGYNDGYFYVAQWNGTNWNEIGTGSNGLNANNWIYTLALDDTGNVYAAGAFTIIYNSDTTKYVAKWNGTSWTEVGTDTNSLNANEFIESVILDKAGNIYAAGGFTDTSTNTYYVAKWNGKTWSQLGTGSHALNANGIIYSLATDKSGNIYAAGRFSDSVINYTGHPYVAQWNGSKWSELGTGVNALSPNGYIKTILTDSLGNVYAAGSFTNAAGYYYVAKWNGTNWSELGTIGNTLNANLEIITMTMDHSGNIYAAGSFTDGNGYPYVAKWNGTSWSELGTGNVALNANNTIEAIAFDNSGDLFAGGEFTDAGNNFYVAEWNPTKIITAITNSINKQTVNVYPNPGTGLIYIQNLSEDVQVNVYNTVGQQIATKQLSSGTSSIDLNGLTAGMYTLVFNGQNVSYAPVKWVKE